MKYYVLLFVLFVSTLQAQVPQLQEWWRADNMGYGTEGMTWIDNFYNGKGALVISTPNGVQTWQLRYPWDTVNVFTWQGGNANIKTGDFNGDGVRDYIDEKGNVYEGILGNTPQLKLRLSDTLNTFYIFDINTDSFTDIVSFNGKEFYLRFGENSNNMFSSITASVYSLDSTEHLSALYSTSDGSLKMLRRKLPYYIKNNNDKVITGDEYALLLCKWDLTKMKLQTTLLDSIVISSTGQSWIISNTIKTGEQSIYRLQAEELGTNKDYTNTNLVIYNLSNDKIEKLSSTRMDGINSIQSLNHSIDGDSSKDWVIVDKDGWTCNFYSGSDVSLLNKIGSVKVCKATELESIEINSSAKVLNAGKYFSDIEEFSCFRALQLDSLLSVESQESTTSALTLQTTEATVSVRMHTQSPLPVSWQLFDTMGRCVVTQHSNQSDASITIPNSMLARRVYAVQATQGTNVVRSTFVLP